MFTDEDAKKKILVRIQRNDGDQLSGFLVIPAIADLTRSMNSDSKFLEFEDLSGALRLVAKSAIVELATEELKKTNLKMPDTSKIIDPYKVLGLEKEADWQEVRQAYLAITKRYHPDQFSNVELPEEVVQYMSAKFTHANLAYNLIKGMTTKRSAA